MMKADRHRLRMTFDDSPEQYDRTRPVCPSRLFDDLVSLAGLRPGARLADIGCGTGQATLPLAERAGNADQRAPRYCSSVSSSCNGLNGLVT